MKKKCGYLDKKGAFHQSLFAYNNANLEIEMEKVRDKIESLKVRCAHEFSRGFQHVEKGDTETITNIVEKIYREIFEYEVETVIELSAKIKVLEKRWVRMNEKQALPRILRKDWWIVRSPIESKK